MERLQTVVGANEAISQTASAGDWTPWLCGPKPQFILIKPAPVIMSSFGCLKQTTVLIERRHVYPNTTHRSSSLSPRCLRSTTPHCPWRLFIIDTNTEFTAEQTEYSVKLWFCWMFITRLWKQAPTPISRSPELLAPRQMLPTAPLQTRSRNTPLYSRTNNYSQSYIATDGQSITKSWCRAPSGVHDQIFIALWELRSCFCGALSLTRGWVCLLYMLLVLASVVVLGSDFLGSRDNILLSQIWDLPFRRLLRLAGSRWRYSNPPSTFILQNFRLLYPILNVTWQLPE
jgi:hypothetical protein